MMMLCSLISERPKHAYYTVLLFLVATGTTVFVVTDLLYIHTWLNTMSGTQLVEYLLQFLMSILILNSDPNYHNNASLFCMHNLQLYR
jgi:hypothetical protein